ncbi:hypothetical protein AB6806_23835 [Bosea sp. RCC_152_1]|uniref:hypothetical protein n=1 Tax=Bosea sp. RCC_152_1 TaxID=3239228 RepID=UPI0035266B95
MGIFGGSGRASRIQMIQASQEAAASREQQAAAAAEQKRLMEEANAQAARNAEQLSKENEAVRSQLEKLQAVAERPAAPTPGPAAVLVTGGSSDDEDTIKRRGRASLKIDPGAPQSGGGQTGLNVPRG